MLNLLLLSLCYLFYFGYLGAFVPFLGLFLDGRGLSSQDIGELIAIITFARVFGPNLWATLADKSGQVLKIMQFGALITLASFTALFAVQGFWGVTLALALVMSFWTAIIPQLEVLTMQWVKGNPELYNRVRLWGSVGFILFSILTGILIDRFGAEALLPACFGILVLLLLSALFLRQPVISNTASTPGGKIAIRLLSAGFISFMAASILLQVSFGPFYGFFALYMRDLGYSGQQTGWLLALGVAAEVVIFLVAGRLVGRFSIRGLMVTCLLFTALRWGILAQGAGIFALLMISQLIHALSFGLTHSVAIKYIHQHFGEGYQSRGQAIYVSIAYGLGGAIGNYGAGLLWQQGSGAQTTFLWATAAAMLAALILQLTPARYYPDQRQLGQRA